MARPKLGDSETERLHIKISADEVQAIEDWRYANRVPSKSEAVRRLVQLGLRSFQNVQSLADAVYSSSGAAQKLNDDWDKLIEQFGDESEVHRYAMEVALAFADQFPDLLEHVFDAHNRMTDFGLELNAVSEAKSVLHGIEAADQARTEAMKRREKWAQEDALRKQMRQEANERAEREVNKE